MLVQQVLREQQVLKVQQEPKEMLVQQVLQEQQVLKVQLVLKER
jgi:hypothetical protein